MTTLIKTHEYGDGRRSRWYTSLAEATERLHAVPMRSRGLYTTHVPLQTSVGVWRVDDNMPVRKEAAQ